jgi:uncharacterized protein (TIGR02147 family)
VKTIPYYRACLTEAYETRVAKNPNYSVRAFARFLGMQPAAVSQILKGERLFSEKLARQIFSKISLNPDALNSALNSLAEVKLARGYRRISPESRKRLLPMEGRSPDEKTSEVNRDSFRLISDWYHYAILERTFVKGSLMSVKGVAEDLGISLTEAQCAIERLLNSGLLVKTPNGFRKRNTVLKTGDRHLTTVAHRNHQRQMLEKSLVSLDEDPIHERNHVSMTLAADSTRIAAAKIKIDQFMTEITEFLEGENPDRVYEVIINLFPLQKKLKETVK